MNPKLFSRDGSVYNSHKIYADSLKGELICYPPGTAAPKHHHEGLFRNPLKLLIYKTLFGFLTPLVYKFLFGPLFQNSIFNRWITFSIIDPFKVKKIGLNSIEMEFNISSESVRKILKQTLELDFEKEAQTWLAKDLRDGDIFLNAGANIGYYVVYANKLAELKRTISIEASSINTKEVMQNIYLNGLENRDIINFHGAVSNEDKWGEFILASVRPGYYDGRLLGKVPLLTSHENCQGKEVVSLMKIDSIIENIGKGEFPNVIVIDVDGNEIFALKGMEKTLSATALRTVILETRDTSFLEANEIMKSHGFQCVNATSQNIEKCWNMIFSRS